MEAMGYQNGLVQQLMDFRTTYLRAVARAAVDFEFRKKLTEKGGNPLMVLKESFGYTCPWFLNLVLHDDPTRAPRVNPAQGCVMTLPYWGESITVYIPKKPRLLPPERQMDALSAYYHENQWFLHNKFADPCGFKGERGLPQVVLPGIADPPPVLAPKWTSVNMDRSRNTRFDLGVSFDDFISFASAIFNAVALSWDNDKFLQEVISYSAGIDPDTNKAQPRRKAIEILDEWLGYQYPWDLDLVIHEDPTAHYNPVTGHWENSTPPVLMLTIPWMTGASDPVVETTENKLHTGVAILGVALYNTDGPGYPFTCG